MTNFNFAGQLVSLNKPLIMGILNITPDSFFDGGRYSTEELIVQQAEQMIQEGADILDIGGYSSRPNGKSVSIEEELDRIIPAIQALKQKLPTVRISIDTFRSDVVKQVFDTYGYILVNDISAGTFDSQMMATVAQLQLPYCMMHLQGTLQTMHQSFTYTDITQDILHFFAQKIHEAHQLGINDIFIDPGFGFSKSIDQNYELLRNIEKLSLLNRPLLIGLSRKSMIWKTLKSSPQEALNGTTALNMIALQKGAKILRVHDVREARECITLWEMTTSTQ